MLFGYTVINTETGKRYDFSEKSDHLARQWVEDYLEPTDVACTITVDANGEETIAPIHRKRMYKAWISR